MHFVGWPEGTQLKATSDWNLYRGVPYGTDTYGFSALPGGNGYSSYSDGSFSRGGDVGDWWSTSYDSRTANRANGISLSYDSEGFGSFNAGKLYLVNVRCLKD